MKTIQIITAILFTVIVNQVVQAQEWSYPAIKKYGGIIYYKNAEEQPVKGQNYKLLFDIKSDKEKDGVNAGLWHIAREVNLLTAAGVPTHKIHIVAVVHGPATNLVLSDDAYQKHYQKNNPNTQLIKDLITHDVKIYLCGQAGAEHHLDVAKELNKNVKLSLSALVLLPNYQYKGYALIP
ncbi:DsrE family protein [Zhouia sp. PK063]|uniref:DsrE family protein n=1 Tax=Zhouia sp. PK063 TaxID=3373602 RepID=UPI0037AF31F1